MHLLTTFISQFLKCQLKDFDHFPIGFTSISTISFSYSGNTLTTGKELIGKGTKGKMKDIKEVGT